MSGPTRSSMGTLERLVDPRCTCCKRDDTHSESPRSGGAGKPEEGTVTRAPFTRLRHRDEAATMAAGRRAFAFPWRLVC
jgi:hypothetical protein